MGHQGVLSQWDDDRGFGFIVARDGAERYFVHISAFEGASRPQRGNRIDFAIGPGRDGKPSATRARVLGVVARPTPRRAIPDYFDRHAVRVWAACLLIALVFVALIFDRAPIWLAIAYALMAGFRL